MKLFSVLTIILFHLVSVAQEKITYDHCNCEDIIETLNPKPHGKYTRTCGNQVIETGNFLNGEKDGEWKSYSTSGTLIKVIHYSNGTLDGDVFFNYSSGKKKLSGSFLKGLKNGYWEFYSPENKLQWDVSYSNGTPTGSVQVYDRKGKKVISSFNFDTDSYTKSTSEFSLFDQEPVVLQDATSTGWFVMLIPEPEENAAKSGLNQKNTDSELLLSMLEIPTEHFNTYLKIPYNITLSFENYGVKSLEIERGTLAREGNPIFPFAVMTNDPDQLHRIEPKEFSLMLLDSKIKETFSLIQPWQIKNGEFNMTFYYIINEIGGREAFDKE
jgi:hypothetical protein